MRKDFGYLAKARWLLGGVAWVFAASAFAKVTVQKTATGENYKVTVEGVDWQNVKIEDKSFVKARLKGVQGFEGVLYKEGAPAVPAIRFYVNGEASVSAAKPSEDKISSVGVLMPNQPSAAKLPGAKAPFRMSEALYKSSELYPAQPFDVQPAGSVRGVKRYLVSLYPLAYNAATREFQYRGAFNVQVANAAAPKDAALDVFAFVVGPSFVSSPSVLAYAAAKRDLGYNVRLIRVGTDANTPDEIRAKLKELYATGGLKHALIFGDAEEVPAHTSTNISGITDHFYRAIDTDNYASDINGPDIGVGRISVKTEDQLAVVVAKYLKYERGNFASQDWLTRAAWLATDDRYQVAEGTHNYVIDTYTKSKGYLGQFPSATQEGGDQLYAITHRASTANVMDSLKNGRTIIDYSGHGATTFWAGPEVHPSDVRAIQHDSALPFVISNACITGDFRVDESFAETWQRSATGAIVFYGSMDSSYWDEDDVLERRMFDAIFRDGNLNFSALTNYGQSELWKFYGGAGRSVYYWETYHVFGDPSLNLRTDVTKTLSVDGPEVLPLGVNQASFTVTDAAGRVVTGARVGIVKADGSYFFGTTTDANGVANFSLAGVGASPASFKVTVYADNAQLVEKELKLVPSNAPYLTLNGFTANGGSVNAVHVGERVDLSFEVKNLGLLPTSGASIQAVLREGPAQLVGTGVMVPALAPNRVHQSGAGGISVLVNGDADSDARVVLDLMWTTQEGATGKSTAVLKVVRAALVVTGVDFGVAGQPEEGGIAPGQTGDLYVTVKNVGTENITGGLLQAQASNCAYSVSGDIAVNALAPGQSVRVPQPLSVAAYATCANGAIATLAFTGNYRSVATSPALFAATNFRVGLLRTVNVSAMGLGLAIPDNGPAVEKMLSVGNEGAIAQIGIRVKIEHTYIGDLKIELVHPDGTRVTLHDNAGGSTHNLDRTWGIGGEALTGLSAVVGKSARGDWKLVVKDNASQDTGKIQEVELNVRGYLSN